MNRKKYLTFLLALAGLPLFTQCDTTRQDLEAIGKRNAAIVHEPAGNYYVGRRYHVPATRFWGYLRQPGQSWRSAKLVIMDESQCLRPDRVSEYAAAGAKKYAYDDNYEYRVFGKYTGEMAYEPNSNLKLPVFKATRYQVTDAKPGWLFKPSEKRDDEAVTLRPAIMPVPAR